MQHRPLRMVSKRDATQLNATSNRWQIIRLGHVRPLRPPIEEPKYPLRPRHRRQRLVVLIPQNLNRTKEDVREEKKADEVTWWHLDIRRKHSITAHQQNGRDK